MGLAINNNVASLTAQNNLNKTNSMLSSSLEKLSTGLKVNRGADGRRPWSSASGSGPRSRASGRPWTTRTRRCRWSRPARAR
jgi:hypothetical protein